MELLSKVYIRADQGDANANHLHHTEHLDILQDHRIRLGMENGLVLPYIRSFSGRYSGEVKPDTTVDVHTKTDDYPLNFTQTIKNSERLAAKMTSSTAKVVGNTEEAATKLHVFRGQLAIPSSLPVREGQISHGSYLSLYEEQRAKFIESFGMGRTYLQSRGLIPFLIDFSGEFITPVTHGELVVITTTAEISPKQNSILFNQEILAREQRAAAYQCSVYFVQKAEDGTVAMVRPTQEIKDKLTEANCAPNSL